MSSITVLGANGMAASGVNLDALIPRADLAIGDGLVVGTQGEERLGISHFQDKEKNFFASALRKPEFQRETMHWAPAKVADLISSFLDQRLIPAVILWRAGQHNFVVDGAHRLSALLAWIHDDYGDGKFSKSLFGTIPPEQEALAKKTRELISKIGHFEVYQAGLGFPKAVSDLQRIRIGNLSVCHFVAQWVPASTKEAAEQSYFKINDAATPLEPTEKRILQSRDSASAIAARAITHGGRGFEYWADFDSEKKHVIVQTSEKIYELLYKPPLKEGPIDTLDVPVAGRGYSVLPFVFDLINSINENKIADSTKTRKKSSVLPKDTDGSTTVRYLKKVHTTISRITGKEATSLGLHPVVYFYTRGGAFSPWAFLAWAKIIDGLFDRGKVDQFRNARKAIEQYLIENKWAMTEIIHKNGSGSRSTPWLERYWQFVIDRFVEQKTAEEVTAAVNEDKEFGFLKFKTQFYRLPGENSKKTVSRSTKTATIWDAALPGAPRCHICGGLWHRNSYHHDHVKPKSGGGDGRPLNVAIAHPNCDSVKEAQSESSVAPQT
jgi:Protein of unknown function DUF262